MARMLFTHVRKPGNPPNPGKFAQLQECRRRNQDLKYSANTPKSLTSLESHCSMPRVHPAGSLRSRPLGTKVLSRGRDLAPALGRSDLLLRLLPGGGQADLHPQCDREPEQPGPQGVSKQGHFPSDEAATKLISPALRNITAKWKSRLMEWHDAKTQFAIQFGKRTLLAA